MCWPGWNTSLRRSRRVKNQHSKTKLTGIDFWDNFGKRPPTFAPWGNPVYSNIAFFVMSLVIERVSGQSYEEFVQKNVLDVAGMKSTTYAKPDDSVGAIGPDD